MTHVGDGEDLAMRELPAVLERLDGAGIEVLLDELARSARTAGDREVMTDDVRTMTGVQLADAVVQLPRTFVARGMRPGQVVLLGTRPGIDGILLQLASMRAGARVMLVDPGVDAELMQSRIDLLAPDWIMAEALLYLAAARTPLRGYLRRRGMTLPRLAQLPGTHVRIGKRLPGVPRGAISLASLCAERHAGVDLPQLDPDAATRVSFTPGTIDMPDGIQHTGRTMVTAIRLILAQVDASPAAVAYDHDGHSIIAALLAGGPTEVQSPQLRVDSVTASDL